MRRPHRRIQTLGPVFAILLIAGACHRSNLEVPRSPVNPILEVRGQGMDPGAFKEPRGIALDSEGHLIVADTRHLRVQELSASGEPLRQWGGRQGSDAGELNDAAAAAMDPNGNLYVVDTWNFRIQKCDPEGHWTRSWAKDVQLAAPRGIAIRADSTVYMADTSNNLIDVFDPEGHCLRVFGSGRTEGLLKACTSQIPGTRESWPFLLRMARSWPIFLFQSGILAVSRKGTWP
jgi:hypothetical protein